MTDKRASTEAIGKHFSDNWYDDGLDIFSDDIYQDLMARFDDPNSIPKAKPRTAIHRSFAACEYVVDNIATGARVLDMACGIGYISHCLTSKGYNMVGFDISKKAIERAKSKAKLLNQNPDSFSRTDQHILESMEENSYDAVLAMGFFRYLSKEEHDYCYRQIARILKPGGKFVVVHQNILFEMFAMNDGTVRFWADTINEFSKVEELFGNQKVLDVLRNSFNAPERQYDEKVSTKNCLVPVAENPLTFSATAESYGFNLDHISCPNSHLLPPHLEAKVDQRKLTEIKLQVCPKMADDWRSMFMDFEFIAFMTL